jgi:hypothetical protein
MSPHTRYPGLRSIHVGIDVFLLSFGMGGLHRERASGVLGFAVELFVGDGLLGGHHRHRHRGQAQDGITARLEFTNKHPTQPALIAAQGLCPRSFDVVLRPPRPGYRDRKFIPLAEPARPLHKFPHGSIKQKTSAVDTRSRLSRCSACRTPRNRARQRGEFGTQRICGGTIE